MQQPNNVSLSNLRLAGWMAAAGVVMLTGCAAVQPYEREHLADPIMTLEEGPTEAFDQHMHRALEGGLAGQPAAGGGCGCEQ
jgi:hypothetical protein